MSGIRNTTNAMIPAVLPEGVREGNENLVRLTAAAGEKAAGLIAGAGAGEGAGACLRIAINGGGCNGLNYQLRFAVGPDRGDILVRTAGIPVLVDTKTALYLKGTLIDYSDKAAGDGFTFANPNAKASCACG